MLYRVLKCFSTSELMLKHFTPTQLSDVNADWTAMLLSSAVAEVLLLHANNATRKG